MRSSVTMLPPAPGYPDWQNQPLYMEDNGYRWSSSGFAPLYMSLFLPKSSTAQCIAAP